MKNKKSITKGEAWLLLIIGLILGSIFTFGMKYWNAPISKEEALQIQPTFDSYVEQKSKGDVQEILVRFTDYEQLSIDGSCISSALMEKLSSIAPGTKLSLLVHPNSSTILDMRVGDDRLLSFDQTTQKLSDEASGFFFLGLFCYAGAIRGLVGLLAKRKKGCFE